MCISYVHLPNPKTTLVPMQWNKHGIKSYSCSLHMCPLHHTVMWWDQSVGYLYLNLYTIDQYSCISTLKTPINYQLRLKAVIYTDILSSANSMQTTILCLRCATITQTPWSCWTVMTQLRILKVQCAQVSACSLDQSVTGTWHIVCRLIANIDS